MDDELELSEVENSEVPASDIKDQGSPLSRDIVTKIVERERKKASEKYYAKGLEEGRKQMQSQMEVNPNEPQAAPVAPQQQQQQSQIGGMPQLSQADIERMIAEKAPQLFEQNLQQRFQQHKQEQTVNTFVSKMQAAEQKYPGLEEKLNELDYSTLTSVIPLINDLDNSGEVMKELVDNPDKLGMLINLSYTQPRLAQKRLADLSNSIKTNEQAKAQEQDARNPLSQIKPSVNSGLPNDKDLSIRDLQRMLSQRR